MATRVKAHPSVLKGEAKFKLDKKAKKVLADLVKKAKKEKFDPRQHSQTIICGEAEFAETKKNQKKFK